MILAQRVNHFNLLKFLFGLLTIALMIMVFSVSYASAFDLGNVTANGKSEEEARENWIREMARQAMEQLYDLPESHHITRAFIADFMTKSMDERRTYLETTRGRVEKQDTTYRAIYRTHVKSEKIENYLQAYLQDALHEKGFSKLAVLVSVKTKNAAWLPHDEQDRFRQEVTSAISERFRGVGIIANATPSSLANLLGEKQENFETRYELFRERLPWIETDNLSQLLFGELYINNMTKDGNFIKVSWNFSGFLRTNYPEITPQNQLELPVSIEATAKANNHREALYGIPRHLAAKLLIRGGAALVQPREAGNMKIIFCKRKPTMKQRSDLKDMLAKNPDIGQVSGYDKEHASFQLKNTNFREIEDLFKAIEPWLEETGMVDGVDGYDAQLLIDAHDKCGTSVIAASNVGNFDQGIIAWAKQLEDTMTKQSTFQLYYAPAQDEILKISCPGLSNHIASSLKTALNQSEQITLSERDPYQDIAIGDVFAYPQWQREKHKIMFKLSLMKLNTNGVDAIGHQQFTINESDLPAHLRTCIRDLIPRQAEAQAKQNISVYRSPDSGESPLHQFNAQNTIQILGQVRATAWYIVDVPFNPASGTARGLHHQAGFIYNDNSVKFLN